MGCLIWLALLMLLVSLPMLIHLPGVVVDRSWGLALLTLWISFIGIGGAYWCIHTLCNERDWIVLSNAGFLHRENHRETWRPWSECGDIRIWRQPNGLDWVVVDIADKSRDVSEHIMPGYCRDAQKPMALMLELKAMAPIVNAAH